MSLHVRNKFLFNEVYMLEANFYLMKLKCQIKYIIYTTKCSLLKTHLSFELIYKNLLWFS